MPVRRAQGGGMFGGALERAPSQNSGGAAPILGTLIEGASTIMRQRAAILLAQQNQAQQQMQRRQEYEFKVGQQNANEQYRQATLQRSRENDAASQQRNSRNDWNANASRNLRDGIAVDGAERARVKADADAKVLKPGMPGYVELQGQLANTRAAATAKFRAPKNPTVDPLEKRRADFITKETARLMKPQNINGMPSPGLPADSAAASAAQTFERIQAATAPKTAVGGRGQLSTQVAPAPGVQTPIAPAAAAVDPRIAQAKALGYTDAQIAEFLKNKKK